MELLVLLFMLAVGVWLIPLAGRVRPLHVACAVVVIGIVAGPPFFAINGPIQISIDRLLWGAMLGLVIAGLLRGQIPLPRIAATDVVMLVLLMFALVSSHRGGGVDDGSSPISRWIFYLVFPAGMYAAGRCVQFKRGDPRWICGMLVCLTGYLAITGILEWRGLHALVFPRFIVDPSHVEFLGRARGPLLNPIGNGILMATGLAATLMTAVQLYNGHGHADG
ncbi:MAG: hypothetical protein AAFP90_12355, partial [Planctomycetota bacterium]